MAVPWTRRESAITLTHLLFGANVAVFLAMLLATGGPLSYANPLQGFPTELTLHFGANVGLYTLSGQWWRLFTYMFLHGSVLHIAFNMWCLWDLGALCESLYGRWTYACIFFLTGIVGGIASMGWNPTVASVGASGAIFGLAGALLASFYLGEFSVPRIAIQGPIRSLLFFIGFNVLFGTAFPGIDNACHIGGLVSGLILGTLIARFAPQGGTRRVGIIAVVALAAAGSAFGLQRWRAPQLHFAQSEISRENNLERVIGDLQKKIQRNPQDASAHYALANAFFAQGELREGTEELKRVLDLDPQNAKARTDLGAAYLGQKEPNQAQQEFSKLISQDPNNADAHAGMGVALADQQNYADAIAEYEIAAKLDPQLAGIYYRLGLSQFQLKQYDDAIASFLKERDTSSDDAELESALADAYQAKGMTQQAEAARTQAARLQQSQ